MEQHNLDEQSIKKSTLSFLKSYYKYRPRESNATDASLDMRGEGGIIADGFLSFKKSDGGPFTSTFEATSLDTSEEVKFRTQVAKLVWDALALGSLLSLSYFGWNYYWNRSFLEEQGYGSIFAILLTVTIIFLILYSFAFSSP